MIVESDNVSEISFGMQEYTETLGSSMNFGIEFKPFNKQDKPFFNGKDFKMYTEHGRVKGEFMLIAKNKEEIVKWFCINVNDIVLVFDKRNEGKEEFARLLVRNVTLYEIHNFEEQSDGKCEALIKFILKGYKDPNGKALNTSRSTKVWAKRLNVKLYE